MKIAYVIFNNDIPLRVVLASEARAKEVCLILFNLLGKDTYGFPQPYIHYHEVPLDLD